ncbi:uncharacterized protein LOC117107538 [Anneissia japonica]|uniref:uncharacterized protein LOC117107538 n=1 Tax=Anneissia japonica TaxID=1529436 RepID=UPI0014255BBF|nr:uncharacterized protein LOC117107538 [Anneissia japonica]XP_033105131.1 uncharacterized protein LOC117107538 [Anneissia japonica]
MPTFISTIGVLGIILAIVVILVILIIFTRWFSGHLHECIIQRRTKREQRLQSFRNRPVNFELELGPFFVSDLNQCSCSPIAHLEHDNFALDPVLYLSPPSYADRNADGIIDPPVLTDEIILRPDPETMVVGHEDFQSLNNQASLSQMATRDRTRDIVEPPTSPGDPYFNDDQIREELVVGPGPPPPYTPPGVPAPPHETHTTTAIPPSYEQSLDHTVLC